MLSCWSTCDWISRSQLFCTGTNCMHAWNGSNSPSATVIESHPNPSNCFLKLIGASFLVRLIVGKRTAGVSGLWGHCRCFHLPVQLSLSLFTWVHSTCNSSCCAVPESGTVFFRTRENNTSATGMQINSLLQPGHSTLMIAGASAAVYCRYRQSRTERAEDEQVGKSSTGVNLQYLLTHLCSS